jgi:protein-S-isoprenylcysteine O-methyltransferase Ste14
MQVKRLVGAGDSIGLLTLPLVVVGLGANVLWPSVFRMGFGAAGRIVGIVLLVMGVPLWLTSAVQILVLVPKGRLITNGPFALVRHPLYTSVALLVIPGCGLVFDSWIGVAIGLILYGSVRLFAPREDRDLATQFPRDYPEYCKRVVLPWL